MNAIKTHWENVYQNKPPDTVSWYQPRAEQSLALIESITQGRPLRLIDVGAGASRLVDDLVPQVQVTLLDISEAALALARQRLGDRAALVSWIEGDVTQVALPTGAYDIWHDRAVFHFLTEPAQRQAYVRQLMHALTPDGHVVMSTFGEQGPQRCSGLPAVRYSAQALQEALGPGFKLLRAFDEDHHTPAGVVQSFLYAHFQRVSGSLSHRDASG